MGVPLKVVGVVPEQIFDPCFSLILHFFLEWPPGNLVGKSFVMFILWVKSVFHLFLICVPFNFYFCLLFSVICVALKIEFLANFIYPHVRGCNHWNKSLGRLFFKPRQPQSSGKNKWRGQQLQINYWSFYLDATLQTGLANTFFFCSLSSSSSQLYRLVLLFFILYLVFSDLVCPTSCSF